MTSPTLPTASSSITDEKLAVLNTNAIGLTSQLPSPPTNGTNPSSIKPDILIAPPSLASDNTFVTSLTDLINQIYTDSERGFWNIDPFIRTNPSEVREFITSESLAIAWLPGSSQSSISDLMGCGRVQLLPNPSPSSPSPIGQFGCLISHPQHRGCGVGRELLKFAEDWARQKGADKMQVELVVGDGWEHEEKVKLAGWYERAGYERIKEVDLWEGIPELGPLLRRGARYRVYWKGLV